MVLLVCFVVFLWLVVLVACYVLCCGLFVVVVFVVAMCLYSSSHANKHDHTLASYSY